MRRNRYVGDVRRAQVEKNLAHVRRTRSEKAALLASLERRSHGVKERHGRDRDE